MKKSLLLTLLISLSTWADENHVHVEQVESGDVCLDCITQDEDDQLQWEMAEARHDQFLEAQGEGQ